MPSPFTIYSIFSVAVCIFTTPAGSLKFGKNFKNTRRYYTSETSSDLYTFINTVSCGRPQCSGECRGRRGPRGQRGRTGSKGQPGPKGPRGPPVSTYFARYLALILENGVKWSDKCFYIENHIWAGVDIEFVFEYHTYKQPCIILFII